MKPRSTRPGGPPRSVAKLFSGCGKHLDDLIRTARRIYRAERIVHQLLGPPYDEILRVARLEDTEIAMIVESAAWSARVRFHEPEIVAALRARLDQPRLERVKLLVRPPETEAPVVTADALPRMSPDAREALRSAAESIGDNAALREALIRLSRRREEEES